jgi:HEPN domain-containing protein
MLSHDLERTHNLKNLFKAIPNHDKDMIKQLAIVGYYYFETNYPGDNFVELDREMSEEAIEIAKSLVTYIENL